MSKQQSIDDIFRSKLENHAFEPPMQLWDNIDKQRNRKRILISRFLGIRLLILTGVLLAIGITTWFALQPDRDKVIANEPSVAQNNIFLPVQKLNKPETQCDPELQVSEEKGEGFEAVVSIDEESGTEFITGLLDEKLTKNELSEERKSSNKPPESNVEKEEKSTSETGKNSVLTANSFSERKQEGIHSAEMEKAVTETVNFKEISTEHSKSGVVEYLPYLSKLLSKEGSGSPDLTTKETDCPTFMGLPSGIYLDINASIDLAQRNMTSKDPEFEDYLLEREKTEIPYFAYSAGIQLTALTERGFAFKTGIDYTSISETFNFVSGTEEWIIINYIKDEFGNVIGADTTYETGVRKIRATNRYQMIDIPLLTGYELDFSNFSLSIYGGPFLNVKFSKKGNFISSESMQPVGITTGKPEIFSKAFRKKLGVGWYASFGFAYKLPRGTQIRVEPYFRFYPKSFTISENVIDQRYFLTGMRIGIRKRI